MMRQSLSTLGYLLRIAAMLLLAAVALVIAPPASAFFGSDPGDDEPFIDSVDVGPWAPSIVDGKATAEQAADRQAAGNRFLDDSETSGSASVSPTGTVDRGRRLSAYSDGLSTARMNSYGLVPSTAMTEYLNGIAARLLEHSPRSGVPFDIRINGSQFLGFAAAYADGVISVPIGLIGNADSEDEIAGLLAHELTHVILNHHDADWLSRTNQQLVSVAEIGTGLAFELGQSMGFIQEGDHQKEVLIGYAASQATLFLTGTVLTPDWTRDQELEADMMAIDLMVAAGYSPEAYFEFLYKVIDQEAEMPTQEERVAALRTQVDARANQRLSTGLQQNDGTQVLLGLLEKGVFEIDQAFAPLRDTHPSTEERVELLLDYYDRHFANDPTVELTVTQGSLVELRQITTVQETLANYLAAWKASLIADGSQEAEGFARQAVSGPTAKHALPRLAFAIVRGAQGDGRRERLNLTYALEGEEPNFGVYQQAIVHDLTTGASNSAFALLEQAWARFKQPPGLYPFKIYAAVNQGDRQRATALNQECRLYFRDNARICTEAMEGRLQTLLEPPERTYVPPPAATGLAPADGTSGSATGFAPSLPEPSRDGGFLGGLLDKLPTAPAGSSAGNQFEGGAGAGNDN
ncbi:MAG: M48 family metalloprotease [Kiloniellales bacterium]